MKLLVMAWRNVWRNHRRSGITIAAMTLALTAELLYAGLVTGMVLGMEDDATEFDLGDVQVLVDGYLTRPSLYDTIPEPDALVEALEAQGYDAAPRLFSGGLAGSGDSSAGVQILGLDPTRDAATLALSQAVAEGAWLDEADPDGVLVGRGLARTLGLTLGAELLIVSQGADGSIANDLFEVRGILMSVASSLDRAAVLLTDAAFRELMVLPDGAHKIVVRRPKEVPLDQAAADIEALVTAHAARVDAPALDVKTWRQLNPFLAQWLESVNSVVAIVYFIIYVAVAILILNAMLMAVFERIREFGVLKAIGYAPWQVLVMMVAEGLIQATVAMVLGVALAAPGMWYLQTHGLDMTALGGVQVVGMTMPAIWRAHYTFETVRVPVLMLFAITFAAVLYPAVKAARISPVEAMHHV